MQATFPENRMVNYPDGSRTLLFGTSEHELIAFASHNNTEYAKVSGIIQGISHKAFNQIYSYYHYPNQSFHEFTQKGLQNSQATIPFWTSPREREYWKDLEQVIIKRLALQFFSASERIVEIGSGALDANGSSLLMRLFPDRFRANIEPTDVNKRLQTAGQSSLKCVNASALDSHYQAGSLDKVTAMNVLDTLGDEELLATTAQVCKVVKDGGYFIHLSDLEPYNATIFASHLDTNSVCIPWLNQNCDFVGLHKINKETLLNFISTAPRADRVFFTWWAHLPPNVRELINPYGNTAQETLQALYYISHRIQTLNPPGLESITNKEFSDERIKRAIHAAGLTIVAFKTEEHYDVKRVTGLKPWEDNYFCLNRDNAPVRSKNYVLAPEIVYRKVHLQVIVAQKQAESEQSLIGDFSKVRVS